MYAICTHIKQLQKIDFMWSGQTFQHDLRHMRGNMKNTLALGFAEAVCPLLNFSDQAI